MKNEGFSDAKPAITPIETTYHPHVTCRIILLDPSPSGYWIGQLFYFTITWLNLHDESIEQIYFEANRWSLECNSSCHALHQVLHSHNHFHVYRKSSLRHNIYGFCLDRLSGHASFGYWINCFYGVLILFLSALRNNEQFPTPKSRQNTAPRQLFQVNFIGYLTSSKTFKSIKKLSHCFMATKQLFTLPPI